MKNFLLLILIFIYSCDSTYYKSEHINFDNKEIGIGFNITDLGIGLIKK